MFQRLERLRMPDQPERFTRPPPDRFLRIMQRGGELLDRTGPLPRKCQDGDAANRKRFPRDAVTDAPVEISVSLPTDEEDESLKVFVCLSS